MRKSILISGASSGFGALMTRHLAGAGYSVYAGMRDVQGRNAAAAANAAAHATAADVSVQVVELDVLREESVTAAVNTVRKDAGRIDVLVHNAARLAAGPTEAFTPQQLLELYDSNVVGAQRLNRAALPGMRVRGEGLIVWIGSSSTRGGTPPYLAPYFATKAAADALALSYALEVSRFGIETTIVIPGVFAQGTNLFASALEPQDRAIAEAYGERYPGVLAKVAKTLAEIAPDDADVRQVARKVVEVVELPRGSRPLRVHIDPVNDGAEMVNLVADKIRADFLARIGLADLLTLPNDTEPRQQDWEETN
jgi:NAD(P)-dependent dehydrogenase (short-subunit alcohol dehydrogenase family)